MDRRFGVVKLAPGRKSQAQVLQSLE